MSEDCEREVHTASKWKLRHFNEDYWSIEGLLKTPSDGTIRDEVMGVADGPEALRIVRAHNAEIDELTEVVRLAEKLLKAIRKHRDQRGDDRCWLDDHELYAILPEGYTPPKEDSCVELNRCRAFIKSRHDPNIKYTSPQRTIESLTKQRDALLNVVRVLAKAYGPGGSISRALHTQARRALKFVTNLSQKITTTKKPSKTG